MNREQAEARLIELGIAPERLNGDVWDLRGANLRGANLYGANLRGANLGDANLGDANLGDADLGGADLGGADLRDANLYGANLYGADLGDADLRDADLRDADLRGANLRGAVINWQSHDLLAELLRRGVGDDVERRKVAGLVLISRDWCWKKFLEVITGDLQTWALTTLAEYVTDGDDAPEAVRQYVKV